MARTKHQEGTVEITGKKRDWTGFFYVYDIEGKRHRRSVNLGPSKGVSKWEARQKLRFIIEKEVAQPVLTSGEDTVEWYWTQRFAPFQVKWSRTSRELIEEMFSVHVLPQIGSIKLKEVEKVRLQILLQGFSSYSQGFIRKLRTYLNRMFEQAVDDDLMAKNPMRRVEVPKSTQKPIERFLSVEEMDRLFAKLDPRDQLICLIACVMGLRPGELFALTWKDYNSAKAEMRIEKAFVRGQIQETKTAASTATLSVPDVIAQRIEEWRKATPSNSPYMFPTMKGTPMDRMFYLREIIRPAAIRAGIMEPRPDGLPKGQVWRDRETVVNFQAMRRSCATWCGQNASIKDVQAIMRHAKAETTLKYYQKAVPESMRIIQAAMAARLALGNLPATSSLTM
jgi:integrase